ncbi:RNA-directed DNA polymerase, eukaryota [Tanacetum coccineum]
MAPRGRPMRLNPDATPTPVTPAPNAPTATTVTEAQLQALINQGVAAAMAEAEASRVRNGYDSNGSVPRPAQAARACSYSEFLKCKPLDFKGTEGVVGLTRWFEKMESVFSISNCPATSQVKFATCTLQDDALTWWNSHVKTTTPEVAHAMPWAALKKMMTDKYCPRGEIKKIETEMWNLKVLGVLEEMNMLSINVQGLGNKTKKEWVKELSIKNKLNFIAIQETKMDKISHMEVKFMWGNSNFDFVCSDSLGNSGGILCIWEATVFKKEYVTISDNFVAIYGTWIPSNVKILLVSIYAPQQPAYKRDLWEYLSILIGRWNGEVILMGDFNEVRSREERRGSVFNQSGARVFNHFISSSGLVDVKLEGYSFTWSHPSATKMSKLDRFLVSDGVISLFPSITAICLDRHLSDHRPILLRDVQLDFGPIPFRFYHSWFCYDRFDEMVEQTWRKFSYSDRNAMIRFKKKLKDLKIIIRQWLKDKRAQLSSSKQIIHMELSDIDKELDSGTVSDMLLARRCALNGQLHDIKKKEVADSFQKSKVRWAIEGDENSSFFHGIINKKRSQLAIRGVFVDGFWQDDPRAVKEAFHNHFASRFKKPTFPRLKINFPFPNRLSQDQAIYLERNVSRNEIRVAVWNYGDNKSLGPGPDGYTFEFFKKYWGFIGFDFCEAVDHFFAKGAFSKGCNSSFIALIPKVMDAKLVNDFRPISLIGCVYKVVTKIFANRLALIISNIVSNTQSAFVSERQILDGPFIINELLHWCKRKYKKAMFFKVDFAKPYDSASILLNGSPTNEFDFHCGLKQGDLLALLLFILVMESLHLSFSRVVEAGLFKGIRLNSSLSLYDLFYAGDALIIGEWSSDNLRGIINVLKCFFLASRLQININKSQLLGVGVPRSDIEAATSSIGCSVMDNQFRYLGVMVGGNMSRHKTWEDVVLKLRSRLSKWKVKTLSIGGRLTLLKSVLGASPLYNMSIFKAPKGVLKEMESIRNNFFIGADPSDKKITWIAWDKVLASKIKGGLGILSFFALNRALILKWVWRFVSQDGSLWFHVMQALYGPKIDLYSAHITSNWCSILREMHQLKAKGDSNLHDTFPRMFALEADKQSTVAAKIAQVDGSFRRPVRSGLEQDQFNELVSYIDSVSLSSSQDRSVSKTWKSFIDSSQFINGYGAGYKQPNSFILSYKVDYLSEPNFICLVDDDIETFKVNQQQEFAPFVVSPLLKQFRVYKVVGACHGLLCLFGLDRGYTKGMVVIWNPSIGKSFGIVVPGYDPRIVYAFGVCPVTSDPTVVMVLCANNMPWQVEVFTLSSGGLECDSKWFIYRGACEMTSANDGRSIINYMVVSFDLITKDFKVVNLPDSLTNELNGTRVLVSKLRESFVVYRSICEGAETCSLWVMQHDLSFRKLFTIGLPICKILRFRNNGEPIFRSEKVLGSFTTLDVYDPSSQQIKNLDLGISGLQSSFFMGSYKESLLLLDHSDLHIYSDDS